MKFKIMKNHIVKLVNNFLLMQLSIVYAQTLMPIEHNIVPRNNKTIANNHSNLSSI